MSCHGRALWCFTFDTLFGLGKTVSKWPLQRAGLSPVRKPATVDQERTDSIRPLSRLAVSVLLSQMGSRILII